MSSSPLRIGLLGCGAVACAQHLPALRAIPDAALVAVADPDRAARARAVAAARGASVYANADELLARDDVDAVIVAAPPQYHAQLGEAVLAAGKHLYLEKPLATDETGAHGVLTAETGAAATAAIGFNRRSHPAFERARALLAGGEIGAIRFVQTAFFEPIDVARAPAWKRSRSTGGGVLLDLGSHHFDQLRWLLREEVDVVRARVRSGWSDQEDATVELTTGTGVEVQCLFSFRAAHADFLEFFGDRGRLRVDRHRGSLVVHRRRGARYGIGRAWRPTLEHAATWHVRRLAGRRGDPSYRRALELFVRRVRGGELEPPTLQDGLRSLEAVLAAERAAA